MSEKRYIYAEYGSHFEILDSWFGYTGDEEPTEQEIEMWDYLVIGNTKSKDDAEAICKRLNEQQDEINQYSNFSLHTVLDKKNKEIEQLKSELEEGLKAHEKCDELYYKLKEENEQLKHEQELIQKTTLFDCIQQGVALKGKYENLKEEHNELLNENKQVQEDLRTVLSVILAVDFKISKSECKAVNRLIKLVNNDFFDGLDCD